MNYRVYLQCWLSNVTLLLRRLGCFRRSYHHRVKIDHPCSLLRIDESARGIPCPILGQYKRDMDISERIQRQTTMMNDRPLL